MGQRSARQLLTVTSKPSCCLCPSSKEKRWGHAADQPEEKIRSWRSGRGPEQGPGSPNPPDHRPHELPTGPGSLQQPDVAATAQSSWERARGEKGSQGWLRWVTHHPTLPVTDVSAVMSADEPTMVVEQWWWLWCSFTCLPQTLWTRSIASWVEVG